MDGNTENGRSVPTIIVEMMEELNEFATTRVELLVRELQEKGKLLKAMAPLAGMAAIFLATAFLVLTASLVSLLALLFQGSPYRWFLASLIVGCAWLLFGGIAAYMAGRQLVQKTLLPRKTLHVLRDDNHWLQHEAKEFLWAAHRH
jgi:uncharacterized membrane protein YqjE